MSTSASSTSVTVEGQLLLCLGQEDALDFRALLRRYPLDDGPLVEALRMGLRGKPLRHDFKWDGWTEY